MAALPNVSAETQFEVPMSELKELPINALLPLTLAAFRDAIKFTEEDLKTTPIHDLVDAIERILYQTHTKHQIPLSEWTSGETEWRRKIETPVRCLEAGTQLKFHGIYGFQHAATLIGFHKALIKELAKLGITIDLVH